MQCNYVVLVEAALRHMCQVLTYATELVLELVVEDDLEVYGVHQVDGFYAEFLQVVHQLFLTLYQLLIHRRFYDIDYQFQINWSHLFKVLYGVHFRFRFIIITFTVHFRFIIITLI